MKKPILFFFLIACAFSWSVWIPLALSRAEMIPIDIPMPLYFLGAFGPMLGALLASIRYKVSSPKELFKTLFQFRLPVKWYLAALLIPFLVYVVTASAVFFLVDGLVDLHFNSLIGVFSTLFSMMFIVVGEEFGWRGFALPYLQNKHSAFKATVFVWLMWGIWHFPASFVSGIFESFSYLLLAFSGFMVLLFPCSLIFTWLHNSSKGKTILAVLLHSSVAASSGLTNIALKAIIPFFTAYTITFFIVGLMLLLTYGKDNLASIERAELTNE